MEENNKGEQGGFREGSGRKKQFEDPVTIGFRVEREQKDSLYKKYGKNINDMFRKWMLDLLK